MSAPKVGDLVDITIRGARIESVDDVGMAVVSLPEHGWRPSVNLRAAGVQVERLAPAEWPPVAGDAWRDKHGELWFAYEGVVNGEPGLTMRAVRSNRWSSGHEGQIGANGPWSLVHREPVDGTPAPMACDCIGDEMPAGDR